MAGMAQRNGGPTWFGQALHSIANTGRLDPAIASGSYGQKPPTPAPPAPLVSAPSAEPAPTADALTLGSTPTRRPQRRITRVAQGLGEDDEDLGEL